MSKEYFSRGGKRKFTTAGDFRRWNDLPYGVWRCANGREVLFNRFYEPIYQRASKDDPVQDADPKSSVAHVSQDYFYSDGTAEAQKRERATRVLVEWGLA